MARFVHYENNFVHPLVESTFNDDFFTKLIASYRPVSAGAQASIMQHTQKQISNIFSYLNESDFGISRSFLDLGCGSEGLVATGRPGVELTFPWLCRALVHIQGRGGDAKYFQLDRIVGIDSRTHHPGELFETYHCKIGPEVELPLRMGKFGLINASWFFNAPALCEGLIGERTLPVHIRDIGIDNRKIMKTLEPLLDEFLVNGKKGFVVCSAQDYDLKNYNRPDVAEWFDGLE